MRLIDADAFKSQIAGMAISNNYPANKANAWCELIDAQPTAYDPDKVVEQLEDKMKELNEISKGVNMTKVLERQNHGYYTAMEHAIEIVKGGGVDGN